MADDIQVKICGLSEPHTLAMAIEHGARYVGFVFFEKSPRYVAPQTARELALTVPTGVAKVALVVNPDDDALSEITDQVPLDMLQLHGQESPDRVSEIREKFALPVMKAIGLSGPDDLAAIDRYAPVVDQLLIDAKPSGSGALPGGNGLPFDWRLLSGRKYWTVPWMLAGGLTAQNVGEAVRLTGARQIDLSSAVESAPGVKDPDLIRTFLETVRAL